MARRDARALDHKTPGFEFALWTLDLVRWLIDERFGIRLSKTSSWRLMNQMGLSAQRPLWRALEQDAAAVERWKREEYPKIQALAKAEKASIWFGDEAGVRSDYHRGTTWAPIGATPVVRTTGARYRWNMISAVNGRGDMRFMLTGKSVTAAVFVEFLRRLIAGDGRPVFLIVDGHPSHRSSVVRQFLQKHEGRIRLFDHWEERTEEHLTQRPTPIAAGSPEDPCPLPDSRNGVRYSGLSRDKTGDLLITNQSGQRK